jgi:hypothetical protein
VYFSFVNSTEGSKNGAGLLAAILNNDPFSEEILDRLELAQKSDLPPRDRWNNPVYEDSSE